MSSRVSCMEQTINDSALDSAIWLVLSGLWASVGSWTASLNDVS